MNKEGIADALFSLSEIDSIEGIHDRARSRREQALAIYRELGNQEILANSLYRFAWTIFYFQGDQTTARELAEESLILFRELDNKNSLVYGLTLLGHIELLRGDITTASKLLEECLAIARGTGDQLGIAWALAVSATVAAFQGDSTQAYILYKESLNLASENGQQWNVAFCLEGLAGLLVTQGESIRPARFLGTAEVVRETINMPILPVERAGFDQTVATLLSILGEKTFETTWAQGCSMTPEQALTDL